jgi:hypothetical protein
MDAATRAHVPDADVPIQGGTGQDVLVKLVGVHVINVA